MSTGIQSFEAHIKYLSNFHKKTFSINPIRISFYLYVGFKLAHVMRLDTSFICFKCGFYPKIMLADVIRPFIFNTASKTIVPADDNRISPEEFLNAVLRPDIHD